MEPPEVIPASMTRMLLWWIAAVTLSTIIASAEPCRGQQSGRIDYNRDIRPILSDKCFFCHGPDAAQRQAELRLDIRQVAIDSGAIDSADLASSPLIERILSEDDSERMPPPESHKSLTPEEKERLVEWVREGAVYEKHWSYQPVQRPDSSANDNKNPVDALIDEELEQAGVQPLPGADRRTLIRRLAFDLMGMPPTTGEVEQFLHDETPDAWQKVVDEFLSRPQYGERMATPWLDVVRYADTVGYHGDQNHNVWGYRDWVIDALNQNMPFDRFTIEQLAGDLLPNPSPDQLVPTCFNRLNMVTREGGAQPEEYVARYMADRVRTVSTAWLGLTMGCAECHDHKYDPSTSRDFYSLGAFFADIQQWGVYHDYPYTPNPDLRGFSNDHPFPPEMEIESPFLIRRMEELKQVRQALIEADESGVDYVRKRKDYESYLKRNPDGWVTVELELPADAAAGGKVLEDGSIRFAAETPTVVQFHTDYMISAIRLEILNGAVDGKTPSIRRDGRDADFRFKPSFSIKRHNLEQPDTLAIHVADANRKSPVYSNGFPWIGIKNGWHTAGCENDHVAVYVPEYSVNLREGDRFIIDCRDNKTIARLRVRVSLMVPPEVDRLLEPLEIPSGDRELAVLNRRSFCSKPRLSEAIQALEWEYLECRGGRTPVLVTRSVKPAETRVLNRGNWQDKSGAIVEPAVPHFLPQLSIPEGRRLTRLDLAQWLVKGDHPLVARVVMNRLWMQFFGEGLVATPDDFGSQGSNPSHPRLLDWLASEFVASGWDMKHMCRVIVTSEAYQRVSATGETPPAADPDNRLLWRQRPRRLTAEMVRDNALAISGLLDLERGGPPIKPLQPEGYYAHLQFPDRPYAESGDRDRFRRSVYIHWQRTFLLPMLLGFDAPTREDCIAMRNEANNPQQALTLLNDPAMVELAGAFAERLLKDDADATPEDRISKAFQLAVQRPPTAEETVSLNGLLAKLTDHYRQNPELALKLSMARRYSWQDTTLDPVVIAVWTNVARVILNLHETITRY